MRGAWCWATDVCISMTDQRPRNRTYLQRLLAFASGIRTRSDGNPITVIPESSIASRALIIVVAIMTFLATITTGGAILVQQSAAQWGNQIAQEITIQIKPVGGRNIESDMANVTNLLKNFPGIAEIRPFDRQDSARMLEPWLGKNIGFDELPIPRLIAVKPSPQGVKLDALIQRLRDANVPAIVDDHRLWRERLAAMTNGLLLVAFLVLVLVIAAMILAIAFATRGAMAGTRDIIDVMHFVGAHDRFISREFQNHFFRLGLKGSITGGSTAIVFIIGLGYIAQRWMSGPGAEQVESLFGSFSLGWPNLIFLMLMSVAIAIVVGRVSRFIVYRHLQVLR
jgi:cell division transport system permease protein